MTSPTPDHRSQVAQRNAEAILDAAHRLIEKGEQPSISAIATEAGLSRVTVYAHFETREAVLGALTHRGVAEVTRSIEVAEPLRGEPREALARVLRSAWLTLGRYHSLVAINVDRSHSDLQSEHHSALSALEPLIERGQQAGSFRADVPASWHLAAVLALIHAASGELHDRRLPAGDVEQALVDTVLGALGAPFGQPD
jgi:AcrR family transcriptional regulator